MCGLRGGGEGLEEMSVGESVCTYSWILNYGSLSIAASQCKPITFPIKCPYLKCTAIIIKLHPLTLACVCML